MGKKDKPMAKVEISKQRRIVFNLLLISFSLFLVFLLEMGLRIFNYGYDLRLFQKSENYPAYLEINKDINIRYFSRVINTSPTSDIFLAEKPDTCYRVFVFGGSTTRGFPYQAGTSFPRILYYRLQDAFPETRMEVVNLSASALSSYTYIDQIDEVLKYDPDLILIYGGHNEYYGALGVGSVEAGGNARWIKKLRLSFSKLRTFQLVQNIIRKIGLNFADEMNETTTMMQKIVKDKEILLDSKLYNAGIEQFRENITEIVKKAGRKGVPVVLSELVSNINDQSPFASIEAEGIPAAERVFNNARDLESQGKVEEARSLYYQAKDLDVIRFRAPEAFNEVLGEISNEYSVPLVPAKYYFEAASPGGIIGNELMLEHLHPNIDGSFLLSEAFFNTLRENKLIAEEWDNEQILPLAYYRNNWGFTKLDSLIGDLNVRYLKAGWPFKPEATVNRFLESYRYSGYVDSMALAYISFENKHIEDEHIKLADYYARRGRPDLAFEEYFSLIKLHPYISDLYFDASKYLIDQEKYMEALELINSAPLMPKESYYYYITGTLLLNLNNLTKGINSLEKSLALIKNDEDPLKVLKPLYFVYQQINDLQNEKRLLTLIRHVLPDYGNFDPVKRKLARTEVTYADVLTRSTELIRNGKLDEAEKLLISLVKVEDYFETYKLLSQIYILRKIAKPAYEYSMRAYRLDSTDLLNNNNVFILSLRVGDLETASKLLDELKTMNLSPDRIQRLEELYENKKLELDSQE